MPTRNVNLSPKQSKFITDSIKRGGFSNASEVVRAALRLLEEQERRQKLKLKALRQMVKEGFDEIDRGNYIDVEPEDIESFIDQLDARSSRR